MNFKRLSSILVLACFLFISCNNNDKKQPAKEPITGKWIFKEMILLPGSELLDIPEDQKKLAEEELKGTIFQFKDDGAYSVTADGGKEDPLTGTYAIKDGSNMTLKSERHPDGESTKISFPDKNTLKIEDPKKKIVLVLERSE